MPNWCECELRVSGKTKQEVLKFKAYAAGYKDEVEMLSEEVAGETRKKPLDENQFIPYPKEFRLLDEAHHGDRTLTLEEKQFLRNLGFDLERDGFNQGGYEWCVENWGTKWGFCDVRSRWVGERTLLYEFITAWSPPLPLIKKMGEMFPGLRFDLGYWEGGMGFRGRFVVENGKVIRNTTEEYSGPRGG